MGSNLNFQGEPKTVLLWRWLKPELISSIKKYSARLLLGWNRNLYHQ